MATVTVPVPQAAAVSALPEPVASSPECEWMGAMHLEQNYEFISTGTSGSSITTQEFSIDAVSAPVPGVTCGTNWVAYIDMYFEGRSLNPCTADPTDMRTNIFTDQASGTGNGEFSASITESYYLPGQFFLSYLAQSPNDSTPRAWSNTYDTCGQSYSGVNDWHPSLTNPCEQSAYVKTGYFIDPNAQASVGSCILDRNIPGNVNYTEFSWRIRKVNCNYTIDSDNGGRSDCDEYADKTNPADANDDLVTDTTAPTISVTTPAEGSTVILGSNHTVSYSCTDETDGSGLASCTSAVANNSVLDTATVGSKSFTITATDNAGNTSEKTVQYNVQYQSSGFIGPVDGNILNKAKAGATIPVQFTLKDAAGNPITTSASFVSLTSGGTTCAAGEPSDAIEQYSGGSGLQYLGNGTWQYNWKTLKTYAGQCRTLSLNLADGSSTTAKFQF